MKHYISLDLETTGINPTSDKIIEVGAVLFQKNGEVVDTFQSYVNPGVPIPSLITNITGITTEDVKDAPSFEDIRTKLVDFLEGHPIVGHNIDFDLAFLKRVGINVQHTVYDTWILATILLQHLPSHSLESLVGELKLPLDRAHRAKNDALSAMHLFLHLRTLIQELPKDTLLSIQQTLLGQEWGMADIFLRSSLKAPKTVPDYTLRIDEEQHQEDLKKVISFSVDTIEQHFDDLSKVKTGPFQDFELREGQVEMSSIVAKAFKHQEFHLIEAGTGIGKSFAYLLPALYFAKSSQKRVVVSTYTNHLQDQLYYKDIPMLRNVVPFPFRVSVLKGRAHYLCLQRFAEFLQERHANRFALSLLVKLLLWIRTTHDGDVSSLRVLRQEYPILQSLVASHINCKGMHCPGDGRHDCFYVRARRRAKESDLVIVNHALLLAESEQPERLSYEYLIVDEAHHFEDALTSQASVDIRLWIFDDLFQRFFQWHKRASAKFSTPVFAEIAESAGAFQKQTVLFFGLVHIFFQSQQKLLRSGESTLTMDDDLRNDLGWKKIIESVETLLRKKSILFDDLMSFEQYCGTLTQKKQQRCQKFFEECDVFCQSFDEVLFHLREFCGSPNLENVYWIEQRIRPSTEIILHRAPINVDDVFHENVLQSLSSCILTSATLTTTQSFDYIRDRLRLDEAWDEHRIASPFDYASCVTLLVPSDIPLPSESSYTSAFVKLLSDILGVYQGKTLVLFASHEALRKTYIHLEPILRKQHIDLFAQGITGGRQKILQMFRARPRSVLLGTQSFWEGIDLKDTPLSCVVIAKLPFPVPTDPLIQARGEAYDSHFVDYIIPQALLTFRQGFGRLIRSSYDEGVVVVADRRILHQSYGSRFLESLPPVHFQQLPLSDFRQFLSDLSTRCG